MSRPPPAALTTYLSWSVGIAAASGAAVQLAPRLGLRLTASGSLLMAAGIGGVLLAVDRGGADLGSLALAPALLPKGRQLAADPAGRDLRHEYGADAAAARTPAGSTHRARPGTRTGARMTRVLRLLLIDATLGALAVGAALPAPTAARTTCSRSRRSAPPVCGFRAAR